MDVYPINLHGKNLEIANAILEKYMPKSATITWMVSAHEVTVMQGSWLNGRKLTPALLQERKIEIRDYKAAVLVAIARSEQELCELV
jgi:hypothetical protein